MTLMLGYFADNDEIKTQQDVKEWIGREFQIDMPSGEIIAAYHSEPDYEEDCWFLLRKDGEYFEAFGSHCSCYGYEEQWDPKPASKEYLCSEHFGSWRLNDDQKAQVKALLQGC